MANIETTANASMVKPNTLAMIVSRFCLRSLRLYAEFIIAPLAFLLFGLAYRSTLGLAP